MTAIRKLESGVVLLAVASLLWAACTEPERESSNDGYQRLQKPFSACFDFARSRTEYPEFVQGGSLPYKKKDDRVTDLGDNRYRVENDISYPTGFDPGARIEYASVDCTVAIAEGEPILENLDLVPIPYPYRGQSPKVEAWIGCFRFAQGRMKYPDRVEQVELAPPAKTVSDLGDNRYRLEVGIWYYHSPDSIPSRASVDCTVVVAGDEPVLLESLSIVDELGREVDQRKPPGQDQDDD